MSSPFDRIAFSLRNDPPNKPFGEEMRGDAELIVKRAKSMGVELSPHMKAKLRLDTGTARDVQREDSFWIVSICLILGVAILAGAFIAKLVALAS